MYVVKRRNGKSPLTARLLDGEHLFFPQDGGIKRDDIGLYGHVRRHGKFLHIVNATHGGQAGLEIWADDDPGTLTERRPLPEPISI